MGPTYFANVCSKDPNTSAFHTLAEVSGLDDLVDATADATIVFAVGEI